MIQVNDYQTSLRLLAIASSQAIVALQKACDPKTQQTTEQLLETIRACFSNHIKHHLVKEKADEALQREIGTAFGALTAHLQAIHASWSVFSDCNNKHIQHQALSEKFVLQALEAGQTCYEAGVEAVAQLLKDEAWVRGKAETLMAMLNKLHAETGMYYRPHAQWGSDIGYAINGIGLSEQTRKRVSFLFYYQDGSDYCYAGLGELFPTSAEKAVLEKMARAVFGANIRFVDKHSAIELD